MMTSDMIAAGVTFPEWQAVQILPMRVDL